MGDSRDTGAEFGPVIHPKPHGHMPGFVQRAVDVGPVLTLKTQGSDGLGRRHHGKTDSVTAAPEWVRTGFIGVNGSGIGDQAAHCGGIQRSSNGRESGAGASSTSALPKMSQCPRNPARRASTTAEATSQRDSKPTGDPLTNPHINRRTLIGASAALGLGG